MTILITGANGTVSNAVLAALPPEADVRVLVRDPGKAPARPGAQVAIADLDEPATLPAAFEGIDTLWLLTALGPQAPHASSNALWAAKQAGVKHVVRMSAIGAAHDAPTRNGRLHALSDAELQASGIPWTILRPHFFMQNLLGTISGDTLYGILGPARLALIDTTDIGAAAAAILSDPTPHAGRTYTLTGPQSITLDDAAATVSLILGSPITYEPVPESAAYPALRDAGMSHWDANVSLEYGAAYARGWGDYTTKDFSLITGRDARSFEQFAAANAGALRG